MLEKRRFGRNKIEAAIVVWTIGSSGLKAERGHCLNLSEGGAGAIISGPWLPGQVVSMELVLPAVNQTIVLDARMCHRNRMYCGFEFLAPTDELRAQLRIASA